MLKTGSQNITGLYIGGTKIEKAYLGEALIFGAEKPSRLPEGYTEIEYIQISGTNSNAHVPLLSAVKIQTSRVLLDVEPLEYSSTYHNNCLFLSFYSSGTGTTTVKYSFISRISESKCEMRIVSQFYQSGITLLSNIRTLIDINMAGRTIKFGSESYPFSFSSSYTRYFPLNVGTPSGYSSYNADAKWYSVKVYSSDVLEHDYVPAINADGKIGFYDIVANVFKAASGYVIPGPAV